MNKEVKGKYLSLKKNACFEVLQQNRTVPIGDQVEIAMHKVGICASDIERTCRFGAYTYPLVIGHEMSGIISRVEDKGRLNFKIGDRVAVFPLLPCFACESCDRKKFALCKSYSYYGSRTNGGMSSYLNVNTWNLLKIPDNVSLEDAALLEPSAVVLHAIKKLELSRDVSLNICILGAGFLGLLCINLLKKNYQNCKITVLDRNNYKTEEARSLGAEAETIPSSEEMELFCDKMKSSFDCVLEFVGAPETFVNSIQLCKANGTIVWIGNISADLSIPKSLVSSILRKELRILGSWNSDYKINSSCDWTATLDLMSKGFSPSKLISNRIKISEVGETLLKMNDHKNRISEFKNIKTLVELR